METFGIDFKELPVKGNTRKRLYGSVELDRIKEHIRKFKEVGFNHLVAISCIDWIDDGKFEVVYHLWSYEELVDIFLSVMIDRDNPSLQSVKELFPQAETYEREMHEMFGVYFDGNDRLTEFILEDWDGPPPMRKDFDTKKYAEERFYSVPPVGDVDEGV